MSNYVQPERAANAGQYVLWIVDRSRQATCGEQFSDREAAINAAEKAAAEMFPTISQVLVYDETGAYIYKKQR